MTTKTPEHDGQRNRTIRSDAAIEALLEMATPRPAPPAADECRIRRAVQAEWDALTGRRIRRRRMAGVALAASLLIGVFSGLSQLRNPGTPVVGEQVATIARQMGVIRISGPDSGRGNGLVAGAVQSGQILETGAASGVALAWARGGSLRIDQNSRIRFVSPTKIRLVVGRIYYDTASDPMRSAPGNTVAAKLLVDTPFATLRHLGTQFAAEVDEDELKVSVREGAVRVDSDAISETAPAGQRLTVGADRRIEYSTIDGADDGWRWVEKLSPPVSLDGRTVHEALRWIGRESGREIRFRTRADEQAAKMRKIRGLNDLGSAEPSKALGHILSISGFDWREDDGVIVVSEPGVDAERI